jgi:alkylation response protein AidB-like acyl-CoA dehydrogenase
MTAATLPARDAAPAPMSVFERYLTVWVFLCIVVGIALGQVLPGPVQAIGRMEVARVNVQNMLFRYLETMRAGQSLSFAEASAIKLYSARAATEVALDAVQVLGGNGYMAEYHVEQLARDAKVLQIYAGTDELQTTAIAKDLLRR